ncbi:hypothetical protein [Mucilaginibacter pedocola]|uniref:hypothetical protein n=1 Tax=Mucilaginibacter pedocola TaxID=1792845 RepID=UPI000991F85C|nr:hypothetical protein [Mucilaginibacter pedocola]
MGQSLRLTFENNDHTFRILNAEPLTRETKTIHLLLDGRPLNIVKERDLWSVETSVAGVSEELADAIVKNIKLRFRI